MRVTSVVFVGLLRPGEKIHESKLTVEKFRLNLLSLGSTKVVEWSPLAVSSPTDYGQKEAFFNRGKMFSRTNLMIPPQDMPSSFRVIGSREGDVHYLKELGSG